MIVIRYAIDGNLGFEDFGLQLANWVVYIIIFFRDFQSLYFNIFKGLNTFLVFIGSKFNLSLMDRISHDFLEICC